MKKKYDKKDVFLTKTERMNQLGNYEHSYGSCGDPLTMTTTTASPYNTIFMPTATTTTTFPLTYHHYPDPPLTTPYAPSGPTTVTPYTFPTYDHTPQLTKDDVEGLLKDFVQKEMGGKNKVKKETLKTVLDIFDEATCMKDIQSALEKIRITYQKLLEEEL
jgi:hypothetical protein